MNRSTLSLIRRLALLLALATLLLPLHAVAAGKGFYPDGQLKYEYLYQDGQLREAKWYSAQGLLSSRAEYDHDAIVLSEGYRPDGSLEWQVRHLGDGRQEIARFSPTQQPEVRYQAHNDQPDGPYTSFHTGGEPKQTLTYRAGVLDGPAKTFYESGQVKAEFDYKNGQVDGPYRTFAPTGELTAEYSFAAGELQ